jgi:inositol monophosphatase 3
MNLGGAVKINKCAVFSLIAAVVLILYLLTSSSTSNVKIFSKKHEGNINLRKLVIGLILAAKKGADEIIKVSNEADFGVKTKGKTKEGVNDYVTKADVSSHCAVAYGLWRLFPKLNLISEEDIAQKSCENEHDYFDLDPSVLNNIQLPDISVSSDDLTVWIDPLDATKEYTEKLFHYVSVMICVAMNDKPIIGVIYFPFSKKLYWSWKDYGRSENLAHVKANLDEKVQNPIAIVSLSHAGEVKELVKSMMGDKVSIIQAAGAGFKIVQVSSNFLRY